MARLSRREGGGMTSELLFSIAVLLTIVVLFIHIVWGSHR